MVRCLRIQIINLIHPEKVEALLEQPTAPAVNGFFQIIRPIAECFLVGSKTPIDVHDVNCPCLGQTEKTFLRLLYLLQNGETVRADIECHEIFHPRTARIALKNLTVLIIGLNHYEKASSVMQLITARCPQRSMRL